MTIADVLGVLLVGTVFVIILQGTILSNLTERRKRDLKYAQHLAVYLYAKFDTRHTDWEVSEDLGTVLTQIDNMTSVMIPRPTPADAGQQKETK